MKIPTQWTPLPCLALLVALACVPPASPDRGTPDPSTPDPSTPDRGMPDRGMPDRGHPVTVRASPLALDAADGGTSSVGRLRLRAAFHLTADRAEFGGFSGMAVSVGGGCLAAVTDRGWWLLAELENGGDGTLLGLGAGRLGPLREADGAPVEGRERRDAEELVVLPGRGYLVTFEGDHRASLYPGSLDRPSPPDGLPQPFPHPREITAQDMNEGMEAAALLADGRLLILAEGRPGAEVIPGWLADSGGVRPTGVRPAGGPNVDWQPLSLTPTGAFQPTGAASLPSGDVLLLERSYTEEEGPRARLSVLDRRLLAAGSRLVTRELARLESPLLVDNMESVAARRGPRGEVLIYVLSDDNFNDRQRTLLMQFELLGE